MKKYWGALGATVRGMIHVIRWPSTDKSARVHTGMWALAALFACVGIVTSYHSGSWNWLSFNAGVLVLDVYMLRLAILGVGYRRSLRRRARRRA
jgi:hypothetical protein